MANMQISYMGFFDSLFGWIIDLILTPVFKFVGGLLSSVFSWIFKQILAPILMPIFKELIKWAIDLFMEIFASVFYTILAGLLKIIDYMQIAFDVFIGFREVGYVTSSGTIKGNLLEILIQYGNVQKIFWIITLGGLGVAFIFTIYAVSRSAFDFEFENKRTVSRVLTAFFKTFIQFFTTPFMVYFILRLSVAILIGISTALGYSQNTSLGRILFVITSLDAAKNSRMNVSSGALNLGINDAIRRPFYNGVKDYANMGLVRQSFNLSKFDYLVGYIVSLFLIIIIGICLVTFVQRIFEIILLYIASPYFVATMPLDDGEKFSQWRDMFLSKCFTGFGSAIGMRLYLMICPMIMANQIQFTRGASTEMEYLMKLFFLIGGAWAVLKSGGLITSILNFQSGQSESGTGAVVSSYIYGHTVGRIMTYGQQQISGAIGGIGESRESKNRQKEHGQSQIFRERRDDSVGFERLMEPGAEAQQPRSANEEDAYL